MGVQYGEILRVLLLTFLPLSVIMKRNITTKQEDYAIT